jgi:hypothetical protein
MLQPSSITHTVIDFIGLVMFGEERQLRNSSLSDYSALGANILKHPQFMFFP